MLTKDLKLAHLFQSMLFHHDRHHHACSHWQACSFCQSQTMPMWKKKMSDLLSYPYEHFRSYRWTKEWLFGTSFFLLFFFFWLRQTFKKQKKSLSPIPKFKDKYFVAKCSSAPSDPLTISSYTLCSIEIFAYLHTYSQWAHEWLTLLSCKKLNNTIQIIAKEQMSYWLQSKGYTVLRENTHVNKANKAFCPMQVHSRSQQIYIFSRMSTK